MLAWAEKILYCALSKHRDCDSMCMNYCCMHLYFKLLYFDYLNLNLSNIVIRYQRKIQYIHLTGLSNRECFSWLWLYGEQKPQQVRILLTKGCPGYQLEVRKSFKFSLGQFFNIEMAQNPFSKEMRSACYCKCAIVLNLECCPVKFSVYSFLISVSPSPCFFLFPCKSSCETGIAASLWGVWELANSFPKYWEL